MKKPFTLMMTIALLIPVLFVTGASAWEFRMTGAMEMKYEYYSQLGGNGFFGVYDLSNAAGADEARSNGWLGIETYDGLFQGMRGWGHVEAEEQHHAEILAVIADIAQRPD